MALIKWMLSLAVTLPLAAEPEHRPKPDPARLRCLAKETSVVVLTGSHSLLLCETGKETARFRVALGSGGVDKRREGDAKTPLGSYALGDPRPSASFHVFIPVEYPTNAQRREGFTGSAVGIHGPARAFRFAGALNVETDWTLGCIALASDAEVERVAAYVRKHGAQLRVEA